MKRSLIYLIITFVALWPLGAQEVLLDVESPTEPEVRLWGQNRRHFVHAFLSVDKGTSIAAPSSSWVEQQLKTPRAIGFGLQYKVKLNKFIDLGADVAYQRYSLIKDDGFLPGFPVPDSIFRLYPEGLKMRRYSVPADLFLRMNFGRRGDYIAWHLDLGYMADLGLAQRKVVTYDRGDGILLTTASNAEGYFNSINRSIFARLGYNRYSLGIHYRMTEMLNQQLFSSDVWPCSLQLRIGLY